MVMTGFLPSHSIETPMPEEKIEGKVESLRGLIKLATPKQLVTTLLAVRARFVNDVELLNALLTSAVGDTSDGARAVLRSRPSFVWELFEAAAASSLESLDKERLFGLLREEAKRFLRPAVDEPGGGTRRYYDAPVELMGNIEHFVEWVRGAASAIFNAVSEDEVAHEVYLQAINFDVPTEQPLTVIVTTGDETVWTFDISPWYGRHVIAQDPVLFISQLMIAMAGELR